MQLKHSSRKISSELKTSIPYATKDVALDTLLTTCTEKRTCFLCGGSSVFNCPFVCAAHLTPVH